MGEQQSRIGSQHFSGPISQFREGGEESKAHGKQGLENRDGSKVLPFEFVALEACLEAACTCLENEVKFLLLLNLLELQIILPLHTYSLFSFRQRHWS